MKTRLLPLLFAVALATGCKKSDKKLEPPKQDFIQLQQVEFEEGAISFRYNAEDQLVKIEQQERIGDGSVLQTYQYTNFTWANGIVQKADYFQKSENIFYKRAEYKYHPDAQKRIAYIARTFFHVNGSEESKDTIEYTFNANNKLAGVEFSGENYHKFTYDQHGNYTPDNEEELDENEVYSYSYDFRYDNHPNPFAAKGLGLQVFSVYHDEPFLVNQLLSANNPVYAKTTIGHKIMGENNQPVYSNESSYASTFMNTVDTDGGLKQSLLKYEYQRKENGNIVDGYIDHSQFRYSCVKKQ